MIVLARRIGAQAWFSSGGRVPGPSVWKAVATGCLALALTILSVGPLGPRAASASTPTATPTLTLSGSPVTGNNTYTATLTIPSGGSAPSAAFWISASLLILKFPRPS